MYDHKNYPPKPQKLPIILTDPNQDSLMRKAVYGPKRGQFLKFDGITDNPIEVRLFFFLT